MAMNASRGQNTVVAGADVAVIATGLLRYAHASRALVARGARVAVVAASAVGDVLAAAALGLRVAGVDRADVLVVADVQVRNVDAARLWVAGIRCANVLVIAVQGGVRAGRPLATVQRAGVRVVAARYAGAAEADVAAGAGVAVVAREPVAAREAAATPLSVAPG
jgi:hypothetical protein